MSSSNSLSATHDLPAVLARRFKKRLAGVAKSRAKPERKQQLRHQIEAEMAKAIAHHRQRLASWPVIDWQDPRWAKLPVVEQLDALKAAINDNQVVVVAGETGSGKTTQLPKICLSLGLGRDGLIGHTQPRRLAARSVAERIAEELGSPLGDKVGYKVRFDDHTSEQNLVCLLTDGMLLSEIQQDRLLQRYQVLIIDEAHERSLNIDFLLGFLKQLLPKRPDLKVIITSATIDHDRFADFFGAKAVEVAGRTYPVEMVYRPPAEEVDIPRQLLAVIEEIEAVERHDKGSRRLDILVFLAGERDIREAHHFLKKAELFATEILPLYARLSKKDQARVFSSHRGRRVVLATNVAETSLTVPGIGYVIDAGTARISRYSVASKVQRLPVEAVSKASANQRAGRAGRLMPGVCFRLYEESDFDSRPEFTEPEIRRTNLASVILSMANMRLGRIEKFPFLDAPDGRLIRDGYRLLFELSAMDKQQQLTDLGRQLARLPLDPRLSRMLFAGKDASVLAELTVIVAALAVQDPCERPPDRQQQADQAHALFRDPRSDFLFYWNLWVWSEAKRRELSRNQYSKLLRRQFLSPRRMQEWRDIHRQLLQQARDLGWKIGKPRLLDQPVEVVNHKKGNHKADVDDELPSKRLDYAAIHRSLLSGLATLVMHRDDDGDWQSCRNRKPLVWPGSALRKTKSRWLVAAEQVETSRLFGRTLAVIQPEWVVAAVPHLLKYDYAEPHWSKRRENVLAYESIALFGLVLAAGKRVIYERFDKPLARQLMIREGLVEGALKKPLAFVDENRARIEALAVIEHKLRRHDFLVDEDAQADFYEGVIPADISNLVALRRWYHKSNNQVRATLAMSDDFLLARDTPASAGGFPDSLEVGDITLALDYAFDPNGQRDGVSLVLPQSLLSVFPRWRSQWLVPGLLAEKLAALLRGLPKAQRRRVVPVPDYAQALLAVLSPVEPLLPALTRELERMTGMRIEQEDWPVDKLPNWLRMNIRLVADNGDIIEESRDWDDFDGLAVAASVDTAAAPLASTGEWCFGELADSHELQLAGTRITRYPALQDDGKQVLLREFASADDARHSQPMGLARLFWLARPDIIKRLKKRAASQPGFQKLTAEKSVFARSALEELLLYLIRTELRLDEAAIRNGDDWTRWLKQHLGGLEAAVETQLPAFSQLFVSYRNIGVRLGKQFPLALAHVHRDISTQLGDLFHETAFRDWPSDWWQSMPRYLATIERRLDNLEREDRATLAKLADCREQYLVRAADQAFWQQPPALQYYRLMLEELRVSLFNQQLGTQMSVSFKRLNKQWQLC